MTSPKIIVAAMALALTSYACNTDDRQRRSSSGMQLTQDGFPDLQLSREVADVSVSDLESFFAVDGQFVLRHETEHCGVAEHAGLGLTAVTDHNLAVLAFIATDDAYQTAEGVRAGSPIETVRETYADLILAEGKTPTGTTVVIDDQERAGTEPGPDSLLYAFDVDTNGIVTALRAGLAPWLFGCSSVEHVLF